MKLEVGRTYRSRKGTKVTIAGRTASPTWPFLGTDGCSYRENGTFLSDAFPEPFDLIEEVETEQDKEQDKVFPIEQDYSLPSYNPNVEAVWNAYVGTIPSGALTPTLDTLIAARKQLVEAFKNG